MITFKDPRFCSSRSKENPLLHIFPFFEQIFKSQKTEDDIYKKQ